jgi:hypothetical protein
MSEFLREKQGDDQVTKQEDGQNERNDGNDVGLHGLPQLLACLDVKKRQSEENYREQQHHYILHGRSLIFRRMTPFVMGRIAGSKAILGHTKFKYRKDFLNKV